jgi:hypothetical protein
VNNRLLLTVPSLLARMVCQFLSQRTPGFYRRHPPLMEGWRGFAVLLDHHTQIQPTTKNFSLKDNPSTRNPTRKHPNP